MKTAYPIFIKQNGLDFLVYVPDMDIYTEGRSFVDAIDMARDAIGLKGVSLEDDKIAIPKASDAQTASNKAHAEADEEFDFSDGILTFVDIDFNAYRNSLHSRSVKKNCTIPYWLNEQAEQRGINFSKVLQEALINALS